MKREGEAKESTPLFQKSRKRNVDPGGVVYFLLEVRGVRGGGGLLWAGVVALTLLRTGESK